MPLIATVEPPTIEGITGEMIASYRATVDRTCSISDISADKLHEEGFGVRDAASATCQALLQAAARQAVLTAMLDKREPNREWFLHNCAEAFDRWAGGE